VPRRFVLSIETAHDVVAREWALPSVEVVALPGGAEGDVFRLDGRTGERWIAKLAYTDQQRAVRAARAATTAAAAGLRTAVPVPTDSGELLVMVEGPPGSCRASHWSSVLPPRRGSAS
jgi:Ser/Thr protein kinase RdoA (MazF antagonist)